MSINIYLLKVLKLKEILFGSDDPNGFNNFGGLKKDTLSTKTI